jgi:hypothetical protein
LETELITSLSVQSLLEYGIFGVNADRPSRSTEGMSATFICRIFTGET